MDNLTQWVIWWSLYTLITWKHTNKNFLLGAGIANIPDLDVFVARLLSLSPLDAQFFHRGIMHSIIFNIGIALVVGYILYRWDKTVSYWRYVLWIFVSILFGHLLIDGMTSYGMRYRLPFSEKTYSTDNIFIIDFGMWAITIGGMIRYMISQAKQKIATYILIVVWMYIAFTFSIRSYVTNIFEEQYPKRWIPIAVINSRTFPEPLQPFLRRHVIKTPIGYYEWYYSIFDRDTNIDWTRLKSFYSDEELISMKSLWTSNNARYLRYILSASRDMIRVIPTDDGYRLDNMVFGNFWSSGDNSSRMFWFDIQGTGDTFAISQSFDERRIWSLSNLWKILRKRVFGNK